MSQRPDDWEKPRSKSQHLTPAEIELLKTSFKAGHSTREAARAIKCSSRVASKYYSYFKAEGVRRGNGGPFNPAKQPTRLYRPDFDL